MYTYSYISKTCFSYQLIRYGHIKSTAVTHLSLQYLFLRYDIVWTHKLFSPQIGDLVLSILNLVSFCREQFPRQSCHVGLLLNWAIFWHNTIIESIHNFKHLQNKFKCIPFLLLSWYIPAKLSQKSYYEIKNSKSTFLYSYVPPYWF